MIKDIMGRQFEILRLSLTDRCNFACHYCVDKESTLHQSCKHPLSADKYISMVRDIHEIVNLKAVRLTGGEPALYHELIPLVRGLKAIGIPGVHLTSNGSRLFDMLKPLKEAGLDSLNISLDAVNPDVFTLMTSRPALDEVLAAIDQAIAIGIPLKVNSTIMNGINNHEILPLIQEIGDGNITIRFLELMKMGHLHRDFQRYFFSESQILEVIQSQYQIYPLPRKESSTANYWITDDNRKFGIIANSSSPFCRDCNRLRLDSRGILYGCLSSSLGYDITQSHGQKRELEQTLINSLAQKQKERFLGSQVSMISIGG
ncbi:MAG: radical SAM protein [Spirochaetota bacterium]|nr:radical SAM protein [Spirochaetota bacterium]